jgi:DNA-binding transcriptional LysR family regulator
MLAELADGERAVSAQRSQPVGTVRMSAPIVFGRLHVAPAVAGFLQKYPEVSVELTLADRIVDLVEDGVDVAIRIGTLPDSSLSAVPLGATQRVVCASPAYLRKAGELKTPADLKAHNFLRFTPLAGARDLALQDGGREIRVSTRGNFSSNHADAVIDAALRGLGVACLLYYQVMEPVRGNALKLVLRSYLPPAVPIHAVYLHPRTASAKVRVFLDHLKTTFSQVRFLPDEAPARSTKLR